MTAALTPFQQAKIAKLRKRSLNFSQIEAQTGISRHTVAKYCRKVDLGKAIQDSPAASLTAEDIAWLRQQRAADAESQAIRQIVQGIAGALSTVQCPSCLSVITVLRSQTTAGCRRCKNTLNINVLRSEEPLASFDGDWPAALFALRLAQLGRAGSR